jgi:tRNA A37 threonylcarbamoyladenosine modification protein TsaB
VQPTKDLTKEILRPLIFADDGLRMTPYEVHMILYIDTTDFNKATFAIRDGKKMVSYVYKIDPHKSHETLAKLGEFLKLAKIKTTSPSVSSLRRGGRPFIAIKKIIVNKGPGSYTGVRVGLTHALALGFAWDTKVSALSSADFTRMMTTKKR